MNSISQKIRKVVGVIFILVILFSFSTPFVKTTHAQVLSVPISTSFDFNSIMSHLKSFVLDGLAWHVAKIMVQQITADTVQWINSGFKGGPAFLTNPDGYFANVADQTTGAFIADTGILSGLCSPFNIDIRLSLALGAAGYGQQEKYTCTLNSVIQNVKNSTINGNSIQGFMNGDFKQGGWPAFIAIGQPNNNASGVYLQAHGDLLQKIGEQQGKINQQLIQGNGFLSWNNCTDIPASDIQSAVVQAQNSGNPNADISVFNKPGNQTIAVSPGTAAGGATSIQKNVDSNGNTTYQNCETGTPGSLINSQLEKQLGSGIDQLNLANSINQVVDALFTQLVSTVLHKGLASASQGSSGNTQSAINALSANTVDPGQFAADSRNMQNTLAPYVSTSQQTITIYQQAIAAFETVKTNLTSAQTCLLNAQSQNKTSDFYTHNATIIANDLTRITSTISQVNQAEQPYQTSLTTATNNLTYIQAEISAVTSINNAQDLQNASQSMQNFVSSQTALSVGTSLSTAQSDQANAQSAVKSFGIDVQSYQNDCASAQAN